MEHWFPGLFYRTGRKKSVKPTLDINVLSYHKLSGEHLMYATQLESKTN